jgi:hypothetical protein
MKALFAVLVTCLISLLSPDLRGQVVAGPITNAANGHWYYLVGPTYWTNAEAQAVALGGHLVTINDAAENAWVFATFANYGGVSRNLFLGFSDEGHEGQWLWRNGEAVSYVNWAPGEPNNGAGVYPYENVAMMYGAGEGQAGFWNDIMGTLPDQQYYGVVEVEATATLALRVSDVELSWFGFSGVSYQAQYRLSLPNSAWVNLGTPVAGANSRIYLKESLVSGEPRRFYRVIIVP